MWASCCAAQRCAASGAAARTGAVAGGRGAAAGADTTGAAVAAGTGAAGAAVAAGTGAAGAAAAGAAAAGAAAAPPLPGDAGTVYEKLSFFVSLVLMRLRCDMHALQMPTSSGAPGPSGECTDPPSRHRCFC